jgi:tRNA(Arg) A34 adenosine deaminase TadA
MNPPALNATDLALLRAAVALAARARRQGNHPFGALLADAAGRVLLEAGNTVVTDRDCTGHAETNLLRLASRQFTPATLAAGTLYSSCEPCPMCAGAIFWGHVGRVVFALDQAGLYALTGASPDKLPLGCREVLARGGRPVVVLGPALETEARAVHAGFWG